MKPNQLKRNVRVILCLLIYSCNSDHVSQIDNPEGPLAALWEYKYDFYGWGSRATPELVGDSLIFITGDKYITCLYTDSGVVKWQFPVPGGHESLMRNILHSEFQLFGWQLGAQDQLYSLDIVTGQLQWTIDSVGYWERHGLGPNYYSPYKTSAYKIAFSGQVLDTVTSDHYFDSMSYYDGKVFACFGWSPDNNPKSIGRIICYDEQSMNPLWTKEESNGSLALCYPIYENGIMYVGTIWGVNDRTVAIDVETGQTIWSNDNYGAYKLLLVGDTLYREVSSSVFAMDKNTGADLWRTNLSNPDESPTLCYCDGYLYVENYGTLYILDAETGEIVHTMIGPDDAGVEKVSAGVGTIYVQTTQHLYAMSPYDPN